MPLHVESSHPLVSSQSHPEQLPQPLDTARHTAATTKHRYKRSENTTSIFQFWLVDLVPATGACSPVAGIGPPPQQAQLFQ